MQGLLWVIGIVAGVALLVGLWFIGGMAAKAIALLTPPFALLTAGATLLFLYPGLLTGIGMVASILGAVWLYQAWEASETYSRIESVLNTLFSLD